VEQVDAIKPEISNKTHRTIWSQKVHHVELEKQRTTFLKQVEV
jgi:hypothetical protein